MKSKKLAIAVAASLAMMSFQTNACSAVIVGKSASNNHSIFIARNEDFGDNNWAKHMVHHPAKTTDGGQWEIGDGLVVPLPKQFYAYSAMPDWDAKTSNKEGKYFEERGVNEFNVAISATNSADVNEKAEKADPLVKKGISEALIPSLILPQVKTAKEGVELLGKYVAEYGSSEGNILYFADKNDLWMMEIGSGHHWIAVKVPDDVYVMVANGLRIHDVDLNSADVLHSEGLFDFVKEHQLLEAPDEKSFNFAKAFGVLGDRYNTDRVWLGQKMLSPSIEQKPLQDQYPLFQKPDQPIDIEKIKSVLSSDYKGTEIEDSAKRPMRVERQLETHVIEVRADAPKPLEVVTWQSLGVLSESLLVPIYSTVTQFPEAYSIGEDNYDDKSAYWKFRSLTTLANTAPDKYYPFIHKTLSVKQKQIISRFNAFDKTLRSKDDTAAVADSIKFSTDELNAAVTTATELRAKIMTDLTKVSEGEKYTDKEKAAIMVLPKE